MKKLVLCFLAVPLLLPVFAFGQNQNAAGSSSAKAITISGRVSEDGKSLIAKNGEPWTVANLGALAGHENQQVKIKCLKILADHQLHVLSIKAVAAPATYHVYPSDSAFRR